MSLESNLANLDFAKMKGRIPMVVQNADMSVRELRYCTDSKGQRDSLEKILEKRALRYELWLEGREKLDWKYYRPYFASIAELKYDCDGDALLCVMRDTMPSQFSAPLGFDLSVLELRPVVVQETTSKDVLMVAYTNRLSLQNTMKTGYASYCSRTQGGLWIKGQKSGNMQRVENILTNQGQSAFLFQVTQLGDGACHVTNPEGKFYWSCFYRSL